MLKFFAERKVNLIDACAITAGAILFTHGEYWTVFVVYAVGIVVSTIAEHFYTKEQ